MAPLPNNALPNNALLLTDANPIGCCQHHQFVIPCRLLIYAPFLLPPTAPTLLVDHRLLTSWPLPSATRRIRPATTAKSRSASAWATIQSLERTPALPPQTLIFNLPLSASRLFPRLSRPPRRCTRPLRPALDSATRTAASRLCSPAHTHPTQPRRCPRPRAATRRRRPATTRPSPLPPRLSSRPNCLSRLSPATSTRLLSTLLLGI